MALPQYLKNMKKPIISKLSNLCLFLAAGMAATQAQPYTWDPGLSGGSGGSGTWNYNSTANWYNGSGDVKWTDKSANGTNATVFGNAAGTVTLASSLSASNLQFTIAGYNLIGAGILTLGAGGIDGSELSSGNTTVGVPLNLPAAQQLWQVGSGATLGVNGNISRNAGASVDFSATGVTTTSASLTNDAAGIVDGWATSGDFLGSTTTGDFISISNSSVVICTNYLAVSSASSTSPNLATITNQNLVSGILNGANEITTITNSVTINSLVQQGDFSVNNGVTLTLGSGGIIMRGESRWLLDNGGGNYGSAVLTSGLSTGELFIHTPDNADIAYNSAANNWRIWPRIQDNGSTPCVLVKDGPGLVSLMNTNSYSGGTIINNGILVINKNGPLAVNPYTLGTGVVSINGPGILELGYTANLATLA